MPLFGQWRFGGSPWQLSLNSKKNILGRHAIKGQIASEQVFGRHSCPQWALMDRVTGGKTTGCQTSLPWRVTFMPFIRLSWVMCFQVNAPGTTTSVYENWIKYFNRTSPNYGVIPKYALIIPQYYLMVHKGIIAPWLVK